MLYLQLEHPRYFCLIINMGRVKIYAQNCLQAPAE